MFATVILVTDTLVSLMGPGVSRALADHRARTIRDVQYDLSLDVTARDSATGRVLIRFARRDSGDLILDFRGRRLTSMVANGRAVPLSAWNGAHIRIPASALRPGENGISLGFVAEIAPSGASIIRFTDRDDGADYLYTLLVPADANQLFPGFDQPDIKAGFTLRLTVPPDWTAVSNAPVVRRSRAPRGQVWVFQETRRISTYLFAFAAGPWHQHQVTVDGRTISAYVRRSRAREADLDTLVTINARGLRWMEQYFGRPYPFDKYDFVLAPAFPFGGMEHPGAVFYSEERFIFRDRPTLPRRLGRMSTILHEVAHMWFGDLVTMRWFDDLWLKEGFATYMAARALADLEPASQAWKTFHLANKPAAYGVDQTAGTTPVWQELGNLDQAKSNYGPIVYNKAPSVLKQLEHLVGGSAFREGVRGFLARHSYGNATWPDLLAAIADASGRPLDHWGRQYLLRPGMPELETRLTVREGRIEELVLAQRALREATSGAGTWPMRVMVLLGDGDGRVDSLDVIVDGLLAPVAAARGRPAPAFVFANGGDFGYTLVRLDSATVAWLESGGLRRIGDAFLRAMLWNALWDEVRAARMSPAAFARLALRELPAEPDEQIVPVIIGRLGRAAGAYLGEGGAGIRQELEEALWAGAADTARPYGIRRAFLDGFVDVAESPSARDRLRGLLTADSAAGDVVRDPLRWDAVTRLVALGADGPEQALELQMRRDTTPDGRRRAFVAGAARPDVRVKAEYFRRYFADSALNEDWATASLGAFNQVRHRALTRSWLIPALDSLPYIQANRRIFFLGSWLGSFLGGQTDAEALDAVNAWLDSRPDLPLDLRRKVLQYQDELERTVAIRRRWAP